MSKVFVSGSLSGENLPTQAVELINALCTNNCDFLIGDAQGVDSLIQKQLIKNNYTNVNIFHIGYQPRNLLNKNWNTVKVPVDGSVEPKPGLSSGRIAQMHKDKAMADQADCGVAIWNDVSKTKWGNLAVSKGTLHNMINLLSNGKPVALFMLGHNDGQLSLLKNMESLRNVINASGHNLTQDYFAQIS